MIFNYFAQQQGKSVRTDPIELNTWYQQNNGYATGQVVLTGAGAPYFPDSGAKDDSIVRFAQTKGVNISFNAKDHIWSGDSNMSNRALLNNTMCDFNPVILGVLNGSIPHFIPATGNATAGGVATWRVHDELRATPNGAMQLHCELIPLTARARGQTSDKHDSVREATAVLNRMVEQLTAHNWEVKPAGQTGYTFKITLKSAGMNGIIGTHMPTPEHKTSPEGETQKDHVAPPPPEYREETAASQLTTVEAISAHYGVSVDAIVKGVVSGEIPIVREAAERYFQAHPAAPAARPPSTEVPLSEEERQRRERRRAQRRQASQRYRARHRRNPVQQGAIDNSMYMTAREAAELAGWTPDYIRQLNAYGEFETVRSGSRLFINRASFEAFLEQRRNKHQPPPTGSPLA